jgi:2'-5' RNA ligase
MTSSGSVDADAPLRLFCALDLPGDVRDAVASWASEHVPAGRLVGAGMLHVTLVFLGARPVRELDGIVEVLASAAGRVAVGPLVVLEWRETPSVGMLVLDDPSGGATALRTELADRLAEHGVFHPESRPWLPHVTVVRHRSAPHLHPTTLPAPRTFVPSGATAYLSRLHPSGARYEALARVPLRPDDARRL